MAHHGGAWKVAYADFVTAMMAFFLLLWLISSASDETRKGLAEFFSNATVNIGPPGGVGGVLDGMTVLPSAGAAPADLAVRPPPQLPSRPRTRPDEPRSAWQPGAAADDRDGCREHAAEAAERAAGRHGRSSAAKAAILAALQTDARAARLKDSLLIEQAPEGLRIQILDRDAAADVPDRQRRHVPPYPPAARGGGAGGGGLPNRVSIRGHTDALPFAPVPATTTGVCRPTAPTPRACAGRGRAGPAAGGGGRGQGRRRAADARPTRPIRATGASRSSCCRVGKGTARRADRD